MATLSRQGTEVARLRRVYKTKTDQTVDVYLSFRSNGRTLIKHASGRWKLYTRMGKLQPSEMAATIAGLITDSEKPWEKIA